MARTVGATNKPKVEKILTLLPVLSIKELEVVQEQIKNLINAKKKLKKEE